MWNFEIFMSVRDSGSELGVAKRNYSGAPDRPAPCHTTPKHDVGYPSGKYYWKAICLMGTCHSIRMHWVYRYSYSGAKYGIWSRSGSL